MKKGTKKTEPEKVIPYFGTVEKPECHMLYNEDPVTKDAKFCGTTASMCGIERAGFEQNEEMMRSSIQMDVMLHAYMFMQSGIPVLYSGDEIGQVNDYTYKEDPHRAEDSRYIHRGAMKWELADWIEVPGTVENQIFSRLDELEKIRRNEKAFMADAWYVLEGTEQCYTGAALMNGGYVFGAIGGVYPCEQLHFVIV